MIHEMRQNFIHSEAKCLVEKLGLDMSTPDSFALVKNILDKYDAANEKQLVTDYSLKNEQQTELDRLKAKAAKWDKLSEKISKCYCDSDGEYSEDNPEIEGADLCTIGEMAASAFGWL